MMSSGIDVSGRRIFLTRASAAGVASLLGIPRIAVAEPPPETTKIRIVHDPALCLAPQYVAEELLRLEGFADVDYVSAPDSDPDPNVLLVQGKADFTLDAATALIPAIDDGRPIVLLAGVHGGCWELFGNQRIRTLGDLRGR